MKKKHPDAQHGPRTSSLCRVTAATIALSSMSFGMSSITAQASTTFAGGNGTTADPFIITTAAQLETMVSEMNVNAADPLGTEYALAAYQLGANIDLSGTTWTSVVNFAGVFNGNGYTISNLSGSNGLFGDAAMGAKIENVALTNVNINGSLNGVGALVGINDGAITNSYSSGSVKSSTGYVGGLVGLNGRSGTISYAHATGSVTETGGNGYIGGLVGDSQGSIADSYSQASVSVTSSKIQNIGGLVGYNEASASDTNVYASGSVTANQTGDTNIGGLMGESDGTITNAYAVGNVTGPAGNDVGGLVGVVYHAGTGIADSFWDTTTTNQSTGVGSNLDSSTVQLTGETDTNMKLASTFSSWPSTWNATNGHYPYFGLQMGTQHLPTDSVGVPYVAYLQPNSATGMAPYTWSITGSLPPGLSLNSNGEISGTPTTSGTASFTVQVKDSLGATATGTLSIDTLSQTPPPTGLSHSNVTQTGWTETWNAVSGATGYNVYVGGVKVTSSPVTGTSYNVSGESAGTTYSVTVTAVTTGGESAPSIPDTVKTIALVNAATPTFTTQPQATQSVTVGAKPTALTVAASVTDSGTVSYQWYSNTSNSSSGGTAITGATSASYTPPTASAGTTYYYAIATNTNNSVNGTKTATATSNVATVTVNTLVNAATPTFTTQPQATQTVTAGATPTALTVAASVTDSGTVTYQWYKNTSNSTSGGTAISGATNASYTPPTASAGTMYYYAVSTNTNNSVTGTKTATATSHVATVTVSTLVNAATPTFTTQPQATQSVTVGGTPTALTVAASVTDSGTVTYQWYKNTSNSTSGGTAISGATNASYTPPTASAGTMYYYAVSTNTNNSVNGAKTATATSNVATVTVSLGAPTGLTHSNVTQTGWTESWVPDPNASSYKVYLDGQQVGSTTQSVYSYSFTGEQPGTNYQVQVASVNGSGQPSALSAKDSVTTANASGLTLSVNPLVAAPGSNVTVSGSAIASQPVSLSDTGGAWNVNGQSTTSAVYSVNANAQGTYSIDWTAPTTPGVYVLSASENGTTVTQAVNVTTLNGAVTTTPVQTSTTSDVTKHFVSLPGPGNQKSNVTINVPAGTFATDTYVFLVSTADTSNITPSGTNLAADIGVIFSGTPQKPITVTIDNPSIQSGGVVYKVLNNGTFQPISSQDFTTSSGQAVIQFQADPMFLITKPSGGGGGGPIPPTIIQDSFTEPAQVGQNYSATVHEIGGTDPMKWSVTQGSLPPGLTLNNQGALSGTPTTAGTYTFTVKVTDANNLSFSKQLTLTVNGTTSTGAGSTNGGGSSAPPATPVSVTTSNEQAATLGQPYTQTLQATGGTGPYTWSIGSGTLPAGLSLHSTTGVIAGTPSATGTYQWTVQVKDSTGTTANQTLTFDILQPDQREVVWNGQVTNVPALVQNEGTTPTTYMPIWYVMQLLKPMGITSTWNGKVWYMTTSNTPDLSNIQAGRGNTGIYLNGTLVQNVDTVAAMDPSTMKPTTYMPIWYVMQLLNRVGLHSTWSGTTWTVTK